MRFVRSRVVRAIVLVVALGFGGLAGTPTMALPPTRGITISGPPDDGGGGGGPDDDDSGGNTGPRGGASVTDASGLTRPAYVISRQLAAV